MVICLEQGADLHMAQLMPLPLTVSCFSKIQLGFTFLVPAHPGSPGKGAVKLVCVYVNQAALVHLILINKNDDDDHSYDFLCCSPEKILQTVKIPICLHIVEGTDMFIGSYMTA